MEKRNGMTILCDTREHKEQLYRVMRQIKAAGHECRIQKLDTGDYQIDGLPGVVLDRKQDLLELCSNVCQQHERFQRELARAREQGIKLIFLCEHGKEIRTVEDVKAWINPRIARSPKATTGEQLYKSMMTMINRYGVSFHFCEKKNTGSEIARLLEYYNSHDERRDP